ncbi:MAG TPA: hexose kinase [Tepidisphaeraceae bacterium]|nr:hexose kinase [Tepidisphaeraceae bacterium]
MIICLGPTPTLQRTMTFKSLEIDGVNRAASVRQYAAGKSINAARVLRTLNREVMALGFSGGQFGELLEQDMTASGMPHNFVNVGSPTRLCITLIDQKAGTATELIEESAAISPSDDESLLTKLAQHLNRAKLLVLSGTLPPQANDDFYARCIQVAGKVPVILDAVNQPLLAALPFKPLVVKPNRSEVGRTLGIDVRLDSSLRGGMKELISRGAQWVVVTQGKDHTLLTDGQSFWEISTPTVKVVSAIGSGDSFAAGLAAGLADGNDLPHACALAAACGAANAMSPHSGHLAREDVNQFLQAIEIKKIK